MFKLNMKYNRFTLAAYVLILIALYMLVTQKPTEKKVKSVRFVEKKQINVRERPAPAHTQNDPNERLW